MVSTHDAYDNMRQSYVRYTIQAGFHLSPEPRRDLAQICYELNRDGEHGDHHTALLQHVHIVAQLCL